MPVAPYWRRTTRFISACLKPLFFPLDQDDVARVARLNVCTDPPRDKIHRKGRRNGQSLTDRIVVDLSRHMNKILDIDPPSRRVRVQAGVVKDQLNAALKPHGLFFAPQLNKRLMSKLRNMSVLVVLFWAGGVCGTAAIQENRLKGEAPGAVHWHGPTNTL
jgi:hypothetical protein